jgi:hypothetical protein
MTGLLLAQPTFGWAAVGIPPSQSHETDPLGLLDWAFVIGALVLAFYCSVRLVAWIDTKMSSWLLFRDIRRELGIGRRHGRTR